MAVEPGVGDEGGVAAGGRPGEGLRGVVAALADGIVVVDLEGRVRFANPAACALFERPLAALVGAEFGYPLAPGTAVEIELLAGGASRLVEMRAGASRWNGEAVLVASLRDVTARALGEREAVAALRRRDAVLATVGHELRNPITMVVGVTQTLRTRWAEVPDDHKLELLARLEDQGRRMQRLVANLLSAATIEAGARAPAATAFDVAGLVAGCVGGLGGLVADVAVSCPPDLTVFADRDHVGEIVDNFLDNALKYGEPPIRVVVAPGDGFIELRVCDGGAGVPAAFVPHLFERFSRDPEAAGSGRGAGLGLSIAADLARANQGLVWYETNDLHGACFCLRLPARTASVELDLRDSADGGEDLPVTPSA